MYPFAILPVGEVQTETLHTFLFAAAFLLLYQTALWQRPYASGLAAGLLFGCASLTRPSALLVGLALSIGAPLLARGKPVLLRIAASGTLLLGIVTVLFPWAVLNERATGDFIVTTDATGYVVWLGNHPDELRVLEGRFRDRDEFNKYNFDYLQVELPNNLIQGWERSDGYSQLSVGEREKLWRHEAYRVMRADPGTTLRLWVAKGWAYWRPWLRPIAYGPQAVLGSAMIQLPLYVAAGLGAVWLRRHSRTTGDDRPRTLLLLLGLSFLASTLVHVLSYAQVRYRLPYVDPYLCVLAGAALWQGVVAGQA